MKFLPLIIMTTLLIVIFLSARMSDNFVEIGHGFSKEKVTEIRHYIFSGVRATHSH